MMGGWLARLVLTALVVAGAAPASATWHEARSRHFIVYSEGSPASVRKFASNLERFDQAVRKLLGYPAVDGDDANPVTVYTLDGLQAIKTLCKGARGDTRDKGNRPCQYIAGWYNPRISGSVAFVPRNAQAGPLGNQAETILFHEYAHHLMLGHSGAAYPAWYVEGFAEFVSNAKLDREGEVGIGLPANGRAYTLQTEGGLTMADLLAGTPSSMSASKRSLYYGRAWLLTHYLTFSVARADQLGKYLNGINEGVSAATAAANSFGDFKKLDDEIDGYLRRNRFAYLPVKVDAIPAEAIRIRQLDPGEAAMMPVRIQSDRGVNNETAPEVAAEARRIAVAYPHDPRAQDILAEAEFDADNLDAAEAAVDRSLAKAPDGFKALIYKALILMRRARDASGKDEDAAWKEVRRWLLRANKVRNDAAWPLALYYQTFRAQGIKPTDNAVDALTRAYQLVPQDGSVRFQLVNQLVAEKRFDEAYVVLAPLAFNPHSSPDNSVVKFLAAIGEARKTGRMPATTPADKEDSESE